MAEAARRKQRMGGRRARMEARAAGLAEDVKPVRPGQVSGCYQPLTEAEVVRVYRSALDVLENIGMGEVPPEVMDLALEKGCRRGPEGRLMYPRAFVEDTLATACRRFTLYGQDPKHDFEVGGERTYFGTGGAAVRTLDFDSATYRPSTLVDLYDFARIVEQCDQICWFTRCVVATDVTDIVELDINTAYAIAAGTKKPIGTSFSYGETVGPAIELFEAIQGGGEGSFRKRPFCKVHISPVVSPLRYGEDAVGVAQAAVRAGMPVNAIIAAQSGATAPAPLAGMLVQTVAETLAGLLLINLYKPGHPVIFSNWPFVIDLRTGSFSGSGGEISVLNAAAAQVSRYLGLPGGVSASMTDSKVPDAQAGYEKATSLLATGLSGANMVYEAAGMYASLLGASFEGMLIDNELLATVQRVMRGIEVNDETIGLDVIREAVFGDGHFLGHDHTINAMERDYYYPELSDRLSPDAWAEAGSSTMWDRAKVRTREILETAFPDPIDPAVDARIRSAHKIHITPERMRTFQAN